MDVTNQHSKPHRTPHKLCGCCQLMDMLAGLSTQLAQAMAKTNAITNITMLGMLCSPELEAGGAPAVHAQSNLPCINTAARTTNLSAAVQDLAHPVSNIVVNSAHVFGGAGHDEVQLVAPDIAFLRSGKATHVKSEPCLEELHWIFSYLSSEASHFVFASHIGISTGVPLQVVEPTYALALHAPAEASKDMPMVGLSFLSQTPHVEPATKLTPPACAAKFTKVSKSKVTVDVGVPVHFVSALAYSFLTT